MKMATDILHCLTSLDISLSPLPEAHKANESDFTIKLDSRKFKLVDLHRELLVRCNGFTHNGLTMLAATAREAKQDASTVRIPSIIEENSTFIARDLKIPGLSFAYDDDYAYLYNESEKGSPFLRVSMTGHFVDREYNSFEHAFLDACDWSYIPVRDLADNLTFSSDLS